MLSKWWIFIVAALAIFMVDVDVTAANLAIHAIAKDLNLNLVAQQWAIDGYLVAAAAFMAFGGRLADIYGAKQVFMAGLFIFLLASTGVGLASSPAMLIVCRLLQGACVGFTFPVSMVLVRHAFPIKQQGFVIGALVAMAGLAQAIGPSLGGVIIHIASWHWIFLVNIPLALIALLICFSQVPADLHIGHRAELNITGLSLLVFGLFSLMYGLNNKGIGFILLGLLLLGVFAYFECRSKKPILDVKLFASKKFFMINLMRGILNFIYLGLLFWLSITLQNHFELSVLKTSAILLCLTLTFGLLAIPAGKVIDKIGTALPIKFGFMILVIGLGLLALAVELHNLTWLMLALMLIGVSIAMLIPALGTAALLSVDKMQVGSAMGILFTLGFVGGSIGVACTGASMSFSLLLSLSIFMGLTCLCLLISMLKL